MTQVDEVQELATSETIVARPSVRVPIALSILFLMLLFIVVVSTYNVPGFEIFYQLTLVAALIFVGRSYLDGKLTEYKASPLQLTVTRGLLVRSRREIPLNRITNYELILPIHKRFLGLADLHVDTAGGSGVELKMDCLTREKAEAFKRFISIQIGEQKISDAGDGTDLQDRRIAAIEELKEQV